MIRKKISELRDGLIQPEGPVCYGLRFCSKLLPQWPIGRGTGRRSSTMVQQRRSNGARFVSHPAWPDFRLAVSARTNAFAPTANVEFPNQSPDSCRVRSVSTALQRDGYQDPRE